MKPSTMRITLLLPMTVLLAGAGTACAGEQEPFGRLTVGEVEALLGKPDVRIIDVNNAEVYAKGHVPGAAWSELGDVVGKLPPDKAVQLVFYCKNER